MAQGSEKAGSEPPSSQAGTRIVKAKYQVRVLDGSGQRRYVTETVTEVHQSRPAIVLSNQTKFLVPLIRSFVM